MENVRLLVYGIFFFAAIVFSLLLNGLLLKFSQTLGIRNSKGAIVRWSEQSKPSIGGISFYVMFLLTITGYTFIYGNPPILKNHQFLGIILSCTLVFLMGLADDAYNTRPWL